MEKVYIFMKMEINMMDSGKMIKNMKNLENQVNNYGKKMKLIN